MDSCSNYVRVSKKSNKNTLEAIEENWEVNSDELNEEFDSDDEGNPRNLIIIGEVKKKVKTRVKRQGRVFKNEVDTNVMIISMKVLKKTDFTTGDPIFCSHCSGALSMYSTLRDNSEEEMKKIWT